MKKLMTLGFIILVIFASTKLEAATPSELFFEANQQYVDQFYKEAIDSYEKLIRLGKKSGSIYYNLANAYFKEGMKGKAILNYKRAKKYIPQDEDLFHNLKYVESLVEETKQDEPKVWYITGLEFFRDMLSPSGWFIISWISYLTLCIFGILTIFMKDLKKIFTNISIPIVILFGISLTLCINAHQNNVSNKPAIVTAKSTDIRYSPSYDGALAFTLSEGMEVTYVREDHGWLQIRLTQSQSGWAEPNSIELI